MMAAAIEREERQHRFFAAMTANLMNAWGCKPRVTVEKLLGIAPQGPKSFSQMTDADQAQALAEIGRKIERQREREQSGQQTQAETPGL